MASRGNHKRQVTRPDQARPLSNRVHSCPEKRGAPRWSAARWGCSNCHPADHRCPRAANSEVRAAKSPSSAPRDVSCPTMGPLERAAVSPGEKVGVGGGRAGVGQGRQPFQKVHKWGGSRTATCSLLQLAVSSSNDSLLVFPLPFLRHFVSFITKKQKG